MVGNKMKQLETFKNWYFKNKASMGKKRNMKTNLPTSILEVGSTMEIRLMEYSFK